MIRIIFKCETCPMGPCVVLKGAHNTAKSFLMPSLICIFNSDFPVHWEIVKEDDCTFEEWEALKQEWGLR